jgi:hypothetical protein
MNDPRAQVHQEVYVEIYNDCEFGVSPVFGHDDLNFSLTDRRRKNHDNVCLLFERPALERFVKLAHEALKLQLPEDTAIEPPKLVSLPD